MRKSKNQKITPISQHLGSTITQPRLDPVQSPFASLPGAASPQIHCSTTTTATTTTTMANFQYPVNLSLEALSQKPSVRRPSRSFT